VLSQFGQRTAKNGSVNALQFIATLPSATARGNNNSNVQVQGQVLPPSGNPFQAPSDAAQSSFGNALFQQGGLRNNFNVQGQVPPQVKHFPSRDPSLDGSGASASEMGTANAFRHPFFDTVGPTHGLFFHRQSPAPSLNETSAALDHQLTFHPKFKFSEGSSTESDKVDPVVEEIEAKTILATGDDTTSATKHVVFFSSAHDTHVVNIRNDVVDDTETPRRGWLRRSKKALYLIFAVAFTIVVILAIVIPF
jgi:hypothetical protein